MTSAGARSARQGGGKGVERAQVKRDEDGGRGQGPPRVRGRGEGSQGRESPAAHRFEKEAVAKLEGRHPRGEAAERRGLCLGKEVSKLGHARTVEPEAVRGVSGDAGHAVEPGPGPRPPPRGPAREEGARHGPESPPQCLAGAFRDEAVHLRRARGALFAAAPPCEGHELAHGEGRIGQDAGGEARAEEVLAREEQLHEAHRVETQPVLGEGELVGQGHVARRRGGVPTQQPMNLSRRSRRTRSSHRVVEPGQVGRVPVLDGKGEDLRHLVRVERASASWSAAKRSARGS